MGVAVDSDGHVLERGDLVFEPAVHMRGPSSTPRSRMRGAEPYIVKGKFPPENRSALAGSMVVSGEFA